MTFLMACRRSDKMISHKKKLSKTIFVLVVGLILGVITKLCGSINNDGMWLHNFIINMDLSGLTSRVALWTLFGIMISIDANSPLRAVLNVLLFYLFVLIGYYGYTYLILNAPIVFELKQYIIYAILTIILPLIVWYSVGEGWLSVIISSFIVGFFISEALMFGIWYINISYIPEVIMMIVSILILYKNISKTFYTLLYSIPIAILFELLLPYLVI